MIKLQPPEYPPMMNPEEYRRWYEQQTHTRTSASPSFAIWLVVGVLYIISGVVISNTAWCPVEVVLGQKTINEGGQCVIDTLTWPSAFLGTPSNSNLEY